MGINRYQKGDISWVLVNGFIEYDANNKEKHIVITFVDITDLERLKNKYQLIADNTSDLICLTSFDLKCAFLYVSPSYEKVLGYKPEELIGTSSLSFIHKEDKIRLLPLLKEYLIKKTKQFVVKEKLFITESLEYRLPDKSGNWHNMAVTANIVQDKLLFVMKDITESKKVEREWRSKIQELEVMNKAMVGRELKMIDLKNRVKELEQKLAKKD